MGSSYPSLIVVDDGIAESHVFPWFVTSGVEMTRVFDSHSFY